ncbi:unnamed protein product [Cutaneotrichosporon oleaginosum]
MNPHESKHWIPQRKSSTGAIPMPPARNPSQVAQAATAAMQSTRRPSGGPAEMAWEHRRRASQASEGMSKSP